jgi:hypothetical protein
VNRRRLIKLTLPAVVALVVAATALAFFTSGGSGTAAGDAASTAQAVTVSAGTPTAQVYPGGSGDVALTITNPNPFPVRVGSLSLDTSQGTNGFDKNSGHDACDLSALSYTTQSDGWSIPAKVGSTDGSLDVDLTNAISLSTSAASACQGATFTVHLQTGS